jgi:hypothetical protein
MSATYNSRIISKLTDLANMLAKHHYQSQATAIRNVASKVSNWKEGKEWDTYNSISLPDADNTLENLIGNFKLTMSDVEKRELMAKKPAPTGSPITNLEGVIKDLEKMLEG